MAMQMNSQQIQTAPEPTKKADPQNLQAAPTGIPTRPAAEPALGNAFPVQGNQQTRMWEGSARPTQANPPGPPLANAFPGMGSAGQSGLPNPSGVVNPDLPARGPFPSVIGYSPGGMVFPGVNQFIRDAGLPFGPQGFPPPPPMTWPPFGSMSPEVREYITEVVRGKRPYLTLDLSLNSLPFYKEIQGNLEGESISLSKVTFPGTPSTVDSHFLLSSKIIPRL